MPHMLILACFLAWKCECVVIKTGVWQKELVKWFHWVGLYLEPGNWRCQEQRDSVLSPLQCRHSPTDWGHWLLAGTGSTSLLPGLSPVHANKDIYSLYSFPWFSWELSINVPLDLLLSEGCATSEEIEHTWCSTLQLPEDKTSVTANVTQCHTDKIIKDLFVMLMVTSLIFITNSPLVLLLA